MAERAIILIPDISGFTGFTGATEIDHAAHIITELLELIVASNETDFTLAEIEGDAVLFYRKGEPLRREQLDNGTVYLVRRPGVVLRIIAHKNFQCGILNFRPGMQGNMRLGQRDNRGNATTLKLMVVRTYLCQMAIANKLRYPATKILFVIR